MKENNSPDKTKTTDKHVQLIFTGIRQYLLPAVLLLALIASVRRINPYAIRIKLLYIASSSMEPSISKGSFIIVRTLKRGEEPLIDEIYTYKPESLNYTITHRLIERTADGILVFKGDNNTWKDPPVHTNFVKYKVIYILRLNCLN